MNTTIRSYGTDDALAFLEGRGTDAAGRTIDDYLKFDADKWEECHNHVQWAFPSHIMSRFNPEAPVVDMEEFARRLSVHGNTNVIKLMENYLLSLGWFKDSEGWHANLNHERAKFWISPYNHNYQRISRLLNLLSWIQPDTAISMLAEFMNVADKIADWEDKDHMGRWTPVITVKTVVFWSKAAIGQL